MKIVQYPESSPTPKKHPRIILTFSPANTPINWGRCALRFGQYWGHICLFLYVLNSKCVYVELEIETTASKKIGNTMLVPPYKVMPFSYQFWSPDIYSYFRTFLRLLKEAWRDRAVFIINFYEKNNKLKCNLGSIAIIPLSRVLQRKGSGGTLKIEKLLWSLKKRKNLLKKKKKIEKPHVDFILNTSPNQIHPVKYVYI